MALEGDWSEVKTREGLQWEAATFSCPEQVERKLGKLTVKAYRFRGKTDEKALVFAGQHGDERKGVDVAEALVERLKNPANRPARTVLVIPELFRLERFVREDGKPTRYIQGEPQHYRAFYSEKDKEKGKKQPPPSPMHIEPNRGFPRVGESYEDTQARLKQTADVELIDYYDHWFSYRSGDLDSYLADRMLAETRILVQLIERERPTRVASLHGIKLTEKKKRGDGPGIFVDPRGGFSERTDVAWTTEGKQDDELARRMVRVANDVLPPELAKRKDREHPMSGNLMGPDKKIGTVDKATVHYVTSQHARGTSFGMWAPAPQLHEDTAPPKRPGMPVVTVEIARLLEKEAGKLVEPTLKALLSVFLA